MHEQNLMQQTLGRQWACLPPALQAHYQSNTNMDIGILDIEYPRWMQPCLNILHLLGALLNCRGRAIPAVVEKRMQGEIQYWKRSLRPTAGKIVRFNSCWHYAGPGEFIEYINPVIGLRMSVHAANGRLYFSGRHFVIRIGRLRFPIPEWLLLGHTTIVEQALGSDQFAMDFRLRHPLLGQIYRYSGKFRTVTSAVQARPEQKGIRAG